MEQPRLYMCLIGCKPQGRHIEQHDIFFGIARSAGELIGQLDIFWPDGGRLHLDAWRKVTCVNGMRVEVVERPENGTEESEIPQCQLYFINLGGYHPGAFEEFHHKLITVQSDKAGAIQSAKASFFYKDREGSHVDDHYGVDIDDLYNVEDILPADLKVKYCLRFTRAEGLEEDSWQIGYTKMAALEKLF